MGQAIHPVASVRRRQTIPQQMSPRNRLFVWPQATGHQFDESDEPKITGHQEPLANDVGRLRPEGIQLGNSIAMAGCIQQRCHPSLLSGAEPRARKISVRP